ncbi:MAG: hypothetical protein PUA68_04855 [Bacilli bacterium]|nr:hypothetical protein [Bacilli bacterium]
MDIIEKMIKKGIYGFDDYFIHDISLYQMIKIYKLSKTKQDRIDFVNALFEKYKDENNIDFTYECKDVNEEYVGACNGLNKIIVNIKKVDEAAIVHGNIIASYNLLLSIYHELQHVIQNENRKFTLQNYRITKEDYIISSELKRISNQPEVKQNLEKNYYIENHNYFEGEIDADINGLLNTYKLLNMYDFKKFNNLFENRILDYITRRNSPEYYDIENKFDNIIDCNFKPFDIEYDSNGKRKSFEDLYNNNLIDKALYYKLLLNKIKEEQYIPKKLEYVVAKELLKLSQDIEIQKYANKDYSFLEEEMEKLKILRIC